MLADVMFSKKQYSDAIVHYQNLLEGKPDNYEVSSVDNNLLDVKR